ncbi:MAG: diacylglycerol kinase family protein [Halofilum sp. (in: g-proteobacteria)]|nr:diacylglycerol kinase family protein [Halofilum sp. (in: g-proteobacteria)]
MQVALRGVGIMLRTQANARIHLGVTLVVVVAGLGLGLDRTDWSWIVLAIIVVWIAEGLNTALERLADALHPDYHPLVRQAKDVAAAAVLIAALGAVLIGLLVFWPYLFERVG